jgi:large subunit ribosomal protein LP1
MPLNLTAQEKDEYLCTYAALILHDDNVPITADKITTLIKAAGGDVAPYWPKLFAGLLEGRDISGLLLTSGGAGAAPAAAAAPAAGAAPAAAAAKVEEPKEEEEEVDMGFSLFD